MILTHKEKWIMKNVRVDTFIQLPDKRCLAYTEYGDKLGMPVFLLHGLPGSRLSWGMLPDNPFPDGLPMTSQY